MKPSARIQAVIELITSLNEVWSSGGRAPADALLAQYYRERRYMGSKDRGEVSRIIYYILRNGATLEWWLEKAGAEITPRNVVMLALLYIEEADMAAMEQYFTGEEYGAEKLTGMERKLIEQYAGTPLIHGTLPNPVRFNYPDWMESRITGLFDDKIYVAMEAMNQEAPVDLRVNTLKATRKEVIAALAKEGFEPEETPHTQTGVRLKKRGAVFTTQAFRDGWFEMQDEGSQMVSALMDVGGSKKVIDFCAGAGGKTLALAARMKNKGRILAWDTSDARLSQMPKRLARAGVHNVQLRVIKDERDQFIKRHKETADWVLLDVPCSGSGTWRRNPDLKWRTDEKDVREVVDLQKRILESAARLVKPFGRLVYATCSIFNEENEEQIDAFLKQHPDFSPLPVDVEHAYMRLYPHQHQTDGFFAAVLQRLPKEKK